MRYIYKYSYCCLIPVIINNNLKTNKMDNFVNILRPTSERNIQTLKDIVLRKYLAVPLDHQIIIGYNL